MNRLFYGDNLAVLRDSIADQSVDLIYLDPPFNSSASYNVLFKAPSGEGSQAQIEAFEDTWHWNESAERAFDEVVSGPHSDASIMLRAMRSALGENDMMAYLAMMAVRLIELHRVLKPTGSIYLHCDPVASHYLKILLDSILGPTNFRSEIIWRGIRKGARQGGAGRRAARHPSAPAQALQETGADAIDARSSRRGDRPLARGRATPDRTRHPRPPRRALPRTVRAAATHHRAAPAQGPAEEGSRPVDCRGGSSCRGNRAALRNCHIQPIGSAPTITSGSPGGGTIGHCPR